MGINFNSSGEEDFYGQYFSLQIAKGECRTKRVGAQSILMHMQVHKPKQ